MHAELNCKICVELSADYRSSRDQFVNKMLLEVRRTIVVWSVRWRKTTLWYRFKISVLEAQKKAIAAVVGGLLEEMLKNHIGVPQLVNVVGPPYL